MFEGFPDGTWADEDYPPPEPPEWWESLIVICGLVGVLCLVIKLFFYGL